VDDVYRGFRIAVRLRDGHYGARITSVRGPALKQRPCATLSEGEAVCRQRAEQAVDRYIAFLKDA
jgi:hypothetical protein